MQAEAARSLLSLPPYLLDLCRQGLTKSQRVDVRKHPE